MSEQVQPVVDCDHHNIPAPAQISALIPLVITGTVGKAASMQPDHHRPRSIIPNARGPDVQILAVVVRPFLTSAAHAQHSALRGHGAAFCCLQCIVPAFHILRRNKPLFCPCVRNPKILVDSVLSASPDSSLCGLHNRVIGSIRPLDR